MADGNDADDFKDYQIAPDPYGVGFRTRGTPLGEGRAELDQVLDAVADRDPDMSAILEHWLPHSDDIEATRA